MADHDVPPYNDMLWPTLRAASDLGGSALNDELVEAVIKQETYTEQQQAVLHGDGPGTEIAYRLAWARTYLKGMGLLDNSKRGVWSVTEAGQQLVSEAPAQGQLDARPDRLRDIWSAYIAEVRKNRKAKPRKGKELPPDPDRDEIPREWKQELLDTLMEIEPSAFERLAQRLLREAGFISATVTGRSGDGGIDGLGVYRLSLVSFPVFYQCKRYKGSVGSAAVRDFRGAMAGRGDKGLLITTGAFTTDAKAEATRDGAPPVDLIDGDRLCDLLKEYELGLRVTTRQVEDVTVDRAFFKEM